MVFKNKMLLSSRSTKNRRWCVTVVWRCVNSQFQPMSYVLMTHIHDWFLFILSDVNCIVLDFFVQLFEYERLVKILLHGVSDSEQEGFVQRIAIYLLNSLACLVDGRQKLFLGDLGAIGVSFAVNWLLCSTEYHSLNISNQFCRRC